MSGQQNNTTEWFRRKIVEAKSRCEVTEAAYTLNFWRLLKGQGGRFLMGQAYHGTPSVPTCQAHPFEAA